MDFLDFIPENIFELMGVIAGLLGCSVIFIQVYKEWTSKQPSTLAISYVIGWMMIFSFWLCYGLRFRAIAIWLPNIFALSLQTGLLLIVLRKRSRQYVTVNQCKDENK